MVIKGLGAPDPLDGPPGGTPPGPISMDSEAGAPPSAAWPPSPSRSSPAPLLGIGESASEARRGGGDTLETSRADRGGGGREGLRGSSCP